MTPRTPHARRRTTSALVLSLVFAASLAWAQGGTPPSPAAPPVAPTSPAAPTPPAPPAPPSPTSGIRGKISAGDLLSAESILEVHRAKNGEDGPYLVGLSWLARGALLLGDTAKADAYAADVRKRCADLLASGRKLKTDHDTETALGAAIEVAAQRLESTKGAGAAADYVRGELTKIDGPVALVSRLNKRINMLTMSGSAAPELSVEDFVGARPPTLQSLRGKPVLLFLWAEGCGDCRAQEATLAKVKSRYADKLQVVAVTRYYEDSTAARVREKARVDSVWKADYKDMGTTPIVLSTASMERYGVSSTPTFVFLDRQGVVRRYTPTRLTEAEFDRTIATLLR
jgi:thiol-disulfide isomerase/thioredoxin